MKRVRGEMLAESLIRAYRNDTTFDASGFTKPNDLSEAEAVQDLVIGDLGAVGGWKLGATLPAVKQSLNLPRMFFGAVPFARTTMAAEIAGPWKATVGVESEYAFRFKSDLLPGTEPISTRTVAAAISSVHAAFEIPASRYRAGIGGEGGLMLVADNGAAGWLVIGEGHPLEQAMDLVDATVRLTVDGVEWAKGTANAITGAPLDVVAEFVRLAHARGHSISAGQFVATGSCTGYIQVPLGAEIVAEFPHVGMVRARFDAR